MQRPLRIASFGALALLAAPVLAQPARDPAAAEATFASGLALLDQGDWAGACPKFRASMELDPSVGAQLNVARCSEHDGKLATAWADFQKVRSLNASNPNEARRREVETFVASAVAKLEPRLPKLSVRLTSAPPGTKVTRNGVPLPTGALGDAIPVDPGPHEIVVEAPDHRTERRTVTLAEAQREEVTFTLVAAPGEGPRPGGAGGPGGPDPDPAPAARSGGANVPLLVGLVVGGLGLASVGGGVGLTLAASSKKTELEGLEDCTLDDETLTCASDAARTEAQTLRDDGSTLSTVGGVLFGVGGAALATGVVLVIVGATGDDAPSERTAWTVRPLVGPGFLGLQGVW